MSHKESENNLPISVAQLAEEIREKFATTGQFDNSALDRILGSNSDVIEFSTLDPSTDLMQEVISNLSENKTS